MYGNRRLAVRARRTLASLLVGSVAAAVGATDLPRGKPPEPPDRRINVADFALT